MKRMLMLLLCSILFCTLTALTYKATKVQRVTVLKSKPIQPLEIKSIEIKELPKAKDHYAFLNDLGFKESGNKYTIVNSYGYMGRYQLGMATLKGLGFKVTKEEFLNNPKIQEQAMDALLRHNKKKLKRYIRKYEGQVIHGVLITESGILAAAHLGGQGNVRKFFKSGFEFQDGFGTSITLYMEKFSGYKLLLN